MPIIDRCEGRTKLDATICLLLFLLNLGMCSYAAMFFPDFHHDGLVLEPALEVARGAFVYRDTFTQYGPLSTQINSILIRYFGGSALVIRLASAFCYSMSVVLLYFIWKVLLGRSFAVFTCLIWIFSAPHIAIAYVTFYPWPTAYFILAELCSVMLIFRYLDTSRLRYLFAAGVTTGVALGFRQIGGLLLFAGMLLFIMLLNVSHAGRRNGNSFRLRGFVCEVLLFTCGSFSIVGAMLFWLWRNRAMGDWFKQTILYPYLYYSDLSNWEKIHLSPQHPFSLMEENRVFWSLVILFTVLSFLRGFVYREHKLLLLSIVVLFSALPSIQYPNDIHLWWGLSIALCNVVLICNILFKPFLPSIHEVAAVVLALLLSFHEISNNVAAFVDHARHFDGARFDIPAFRGMRGMPGRVVPVAKIYEGIKHALDEQPTKPLTAISFPEIPFRYDLDMTFLLTCFPKRDDFRPLFVNWPTLNTKVYPHYAEDKGRWIRANLPFVLTTRYHLAAAAKRLGIEREIEERYEVRELLRGSGFLLLVPESSAKKLSSGRSTPANG